MNPSLENLGLMLELQGSQNTKNCLLHAYEGYDDAPMLGSLAIECQIGGKWFIYVGS